MLPSVRLRLSQRLKLMLLFSMEDMAMVVLAMLVLATMARGLLMLSLRPRLMLLFSMEDMAMADMEVMVLDMEDMVLDMAVVSTMVKHQIHANKSSKVILLLFSALYWGRNCNVEIE